MKAEFLEEHQEEVDIIVIETIQALIQEGRLRIGTDEYEEKLQLELDGEGPDYRYSDSATVKMNYIVQRGAVEPSDKQSWMGW